MMKKIKLLLATLMVVTIASDGFAQNRGFVKIRKEAKDHVALIIGNSNYPDMRLANPKNDANEVAKTFQNMGFIVEKVIDADKEKMAMAINSFKLKLASARAAVFYFAGHGMQVDGENYLIPIGTTPATQIQTEEQVPYRAINAGEILAAMEQQNVKFSLVALDACRNNPIKSSGRGKIKGLASIDAPAGSLVMYATKAGDVASDGSAKNSPFTAAFLEHITTPGLDVNLLPSRVTQTVREITNGKQTLGSYVQLTQSFAFVPEYTTEEIEQILQDQEGKLNELELEEARQKMQKEKEDADLANRMAKIEAMEQKIENMKNATATGGADLDKMLAIVEQREKEKKELEAMKRKVEEERKAREKEIVEMKKKKFDDNVAKYEKIANSEFGQDMKEAAWNSVLKEFGLDRGSIGTGDITSLKDKLDLYEYFIDSRDGKKYKTVKIDNQVWMAENLAYKPSSGNYWAYDNNSSNVDKYGYLYDWETAKKACPSGWHLPSDDEWEQLAKHISNDKGPYSKDDDDWENLGKHLKSRTGWENNGNGTDDYGFCGLPGGYRYGNGGFGDVGYDSDWWSGTECSTGGAWNRHLDVYYSNFYRNDFSKGWGFSVRCVRD